MGVKFIYDFRINKNGKPYAVKISAKTGKVIEKVSKPNKIKTYKKRVKSQKYRQKQTLLKKQFKDIAKTYDGDSISLEIKYKRQLAKEIAAEKRRVKELKKEGQKPYGRKRKTLEGDSLEFVRRSAGYVTVFRFWWVVKVGRDTPEIWGQEAGSFEGNQFTETKDYVNDISKAIIDEVKGTKGAVFVSGSGACVRLINRETQKTIKSYPIGAGCVRT